MIKHTPRPWHEWSDIDEDGISDFIVGKKTADGFPIIAEMYTDDNPADKALIIAAPDLFAACARLLELIDDVYHGDGELPLEDIMDDARAAIAKAKVVIDG